MAGWWLSRGSVAAGHTANPAAGLALADKLAANPQDWLVVNRYL